MGRVEKKRKIRPPFWLELEEPEYQQALSKAKLSASRQEFAVWLNLIDPDGSHLAETKDPIRALQGEETPPLDPFLDCISSLRVRTNGGSSTLSNFIAQGLVRYSRSSDELEPNYQHMVEDIGNLRLTKENIQLHEVLSNEYIEFLARYPLKIRGPLQWANQYLELPIESEPYNGTRQPAAIDPGLIPPRFVHTWGLDLSKDIDWFNLSFDSIQDIQLKWLKTVKLIL